MQKNKQQLRSEIKARLQSLSNEEKVCQSENILRQLEELPLFQQAGIVLLYWSLPSEVQTHKIVEKWSKKKTILLPVVYGNELLIKAYTDNSCLEIGAFEVCEPNTEEFTNLSAIDLCIVPGLAFDKNGNRLGKGKGFYDKLLPKISCPKIGICYDVQLVDNIPCDEWDEKVDFVVYLH
jgi:5-formyltetrahydrofolate cyclo-ligase